MVLVATDWPADLERTLAGLRAHSADGTSIVVVADGPAPDQDAALPDDDASIEVVRTTERLGTAAAWNIGIRRAAGPSSSSSTRRSSPPATSSRRSSRRSPTRRSASPGGSGSAAPTSAPFADAGPGDVTAIEGYAIAFRRSDAAARGPLDERFRFYRNLDIWWSLVLRDEGEGSPPRRAVAVPIPAIRHEHRGWTALPEAERDRLSKRNFYRIIDRFGHRRDLAGPG